LSSAMCFSMVVTLISKRLMISKLVFTARNLTSSDAIAG
jgi:hypothetical protein